jgi:predicted CXXCH cytochrome family protein
MVTLPLTCGSLCPNLESEDADLVRRPLVLHRIGTTRGQGRLYTAALGLVVLAILLVLPAAAFAFHTDGRETRGTVAFACEDCHVTWAGGSDAGDATKDGAGPHGYYRSDTDKCRMCHTVHKAPAGSILLLPAATIQATCFTCHDNTGAAGVYSAIAARGGSVVASHSIETTSHVPGGAADLTAKLGCPSCHSVHRATNVEAFRTDRKLPLGGAKFSNALLRDDVGGHARGTFTHYGADWCAACHDQRMSGGAVVNHPTEPSGSGAFDYGRIASVTGVNDQTTEILADLDPPTTNGTGLGGSNFGYIMPYPRTAQQGTHKPICQQCHEDARSVGVPGAAVAFSSTTPTNPLFYSFPHQSTNVNFVIEENDNLCFNCHPITQLP